MRLIDRIEAAVGPDHELDAAIELATGNWTQSHYDAWQRYAETGEVGEGGAVPIGPNRYTASIDAAISRIPDGITDWAAGTAIGGKAFCQLDFGHAVYASTVPLAILLAIVKDVPLPGSLDGDHIA